MSYSLEKSNYGQVLRLAWIVGADSKRGRLKTTPGRKGGKEKWKKKE
jgi:hypothetical protein